LALGALSSLGKPDQDYVFVADYDELKGKTAAEATRLLGEAMEDKDIVSAIIFPIEPNHVAVFPANARGVLQVIENVEKNEPIEKDKLFDVASKLDDSAAYSALHIESTAPHLYEWSWNYYKKYYGAYCAVALQFRCHPTDAAKWIGSLEDDWHPLGFAINVEEKMGMADSFSPADPCDKDYKKQLCEIADWEKAKSQFQDYGVRVFLVRNMQIDKIIGRVMIEFNDPWREQIPILFIQ